MRKGPITAEEQTLALATARAVNAAGGLEAASMLGKTIVESFTSKTTIHRACDPYSHDSITVRDVYALEAITHGSPGHPHITRALAQMAGYILVRQPKGGEDADGIMRSVITLTSELGDVSHSIAESLSDDFISPGEARAALKELDELDVASATLRLKLGAIVEGEKNGGRRRA